MVSAAENLSRLEGTVTDRVPHPRIDGWDLVTLEVHSAEPVPGRADLLTRQVREPLEVAVRRDLLGDAVPGVRLVARVRMTTAGAVAESRPAPGDFEVRSAPTGRDGPGGR